MTASVADLELVKEIERLRSINIDMLSALKAIDRCYYISARSAIGRYSFPSSGPTADRLQRAIRRAEGRDK